MTGREQRLLVLGASLLAVSVVVTRIAPAGMRYSQSAVEQSRARAGQAARAAMMIQSLPTLRDSLGGVAASLVAAAPLLMEGRTPADAATSLSVWITLASERERLRIRQLESQPDSGRGAIRPVTVRAQLEGDIAGIGGFLRHVEAGAPLLSVREFSLTTLDASGRLGGTETLRFELAIRGWYLGALDP